MTLTIPSKLHGDRIWRRVGERPYTTRDGRPILLAVWETPCVICGEPFQIALTPNIASVEKSRSFEVTTCPAHRMTPDERWRLKKRCKPSARRKKFEAIKKAKLNHGEPK